MLLVFWVDQNPTDTPVSLIPMTWVWIPVGKFSFVNDERLAQAEHVSLVRVTRGAGAEIPGDLAVVVNAQQLVERGVVAVVQLAERPAAGQAHFARVVLAVRVGREADAGVRAGVPGHGENTADRSAHRDGRHADRRYDCTSTHSGSAILGPRSCASSPSYLVLTENPFPCIQMTAPGLSRAITGGIESGRVDDVSGGRGKSRAKPRPGSGNRNNSPRPGNGQRDRGARQGRKSRAAGLASRGSAR